MKPQATPEQVKWLENIKLACELGAFDKRQIIILPAEMPTLAGAIAAILADARALAALALQPAPERLREQVAVMLHKGFTATAEYEQVADLLIQSHIAPLLARVRELERALSSACILAEKLMAEARKNT